MQELDELKANIIQLEKHIESQDMEVYRQQRLIQSLSEKLKKMEARLESLEQGGGGDTMPADEKPPHY